MAGCRAALHPVCEYRLGFVLAAAGGRCWHLIEGTEKSIQLRNNWAPRPVCTQWVPTSFSLAYWDDEGAGERLQGEKGPGSWWPGMQALHP